MATATALRLGPADHGRALTLAEFLDADVEEGYRYELARGVLEVTQVPNDPHGMIVSDLYVRLGQYKLAHPGVILRLGGSGEFQLIIPGLESGRNPDVAVVLAGTPKDERGRRPPSLVMEVVSEGADARERDYATKRQEYLAFGLREYWIIDPIERRITVLIRNGDVWTERVFVGDATAEGLVLPGFRVPLAELWARAQD